MDEIRTSKDLLLEIVYCFYLFLEFVCSGLLLKKCTWLNNMQDV